MTYQVPEGSKTEVHLHSAQRQKPDWLAEVQIAPTSLPPRAADPVPLLFDAENRPISTVAGWGHRKDELSRSWRAFLGTIPDPRPDNTLKVLNEERLDEIIRQLVSYEAERALPVEGYLLRPAGPGRGRPGAVVFHSTANWTI
jgi:hypothetical protein